VGCIIRKFRLGGIDCRVIGWIWELFVCLLGGLGKVCINCGFR
jgi:hypothetical protein